MRFTRAGIRPLALLAVTSLVIVACSSDDKPAATSAETTVGSNGSVPIASDGSSATTGEIPDGSADSVLATSPGTVPGSDGTHYDRWSPPGSGAEVDSITWSVPFEATSLDPLRAWAYPENTILSNMCESVVSLTPDLQLEPGLASDIDLSDPTKVVLTVRSGVKFWDGAEMTADDVAFSLGRNLDPALGGYFGAMWVNVASVDVTGTDQVTISLSAPDSQLWKSLSMASGVVIERAFAEAAGDTYGTPDVGIMCTGPYQFGSWTPGDSIVIEKAADYWNPDLVPAVQEVVFRPISDSAALTAALLTGEIDGTFKSPMESVPTLQDASDMGTLYRGESTETLMMIPNTDGPLGDVRVRQAVSLVIDRTLLAETAFGGFASPGKSIDSASTWGYATDTFASSYAELPTPDTADVAKAEELLADYVADKGEITKPLILWAPGSAQAYVLTANAIADAAESIGIPMTVETPPAQEYVYWLYDPATRVDTDLYMTPWWTDYPDPLEAFLPITLPGIFNPFEYTNPKVDDLLAQAVAESDDSARADLLVEARQIMFGDDLMWIPMLDLASPTWLGKRITGTPVGVPATMYTPWAAYLSAP